MAKTKQQIEAIHARQLNMQNQLERLGVYIAKLDKMGFNNKRINTIGVEFQSTIKDLDAQQNCNKYLWKNMPKYLSGWLVEYMLYLRGSLCGFISGGVIYILPYAQNKGLNVYGMPNAVQPVTFNGAMVEGGKPSNNKDTPFGKELPVNNFGAPNENAGACILYDRIPVYSTNSSPIGRAWLNDVLIKNQCEIMARIRNNLMNTDKKCVFWVDSEAQKNQMMRDLQDAYGTDDPFIVAVRGSQLDRNNSDTLQGDIANETQSLFEAWQSFNSIRCMCSGIANGGAFEKKERQITGELQGDNVQTDIVLDAGLQMRRLFLEQMKAIYPNNEELKKITVEINERSISYDEVDTDDSIEEGGEDYE